ncbi:MAG: hypothetical protein LGR52_03340 [Candidatus Thiosymbion ectosymbiont of Robbea hypermnestra]|nr:hypothetical protein [Candidatus Thiosymbion ectosymbiont of Robbea hypermnestra]
MATENENGNGVVNTGPRIRVTPSAQLIADTLLGGFKRLEKEMDDREKLAEKKMARRGKLLVWVMAILLVFSAFALPAIAKFMYDLKQAMEHMDENMDQMSLYMGEMNVNMLDMRNSMMGMGKDMGDMRNSMFNMDESMTAMSKNINDMRGNIANMDSSMSTMNQAVQAMTGHVSMMDLGMRNMNYSVHEMDHTMQYPMRSIGNLVPWRW